MDSQRSTTRTALGLYGVLLVLPTLVFGWLYWRELEKDFDRQLQAVPEQAHTGARRIVTGMRARLQRLLDAEAQRPFFQYGPVCLQEDVLDDDLLLQSSPMVRETMPQGIQAWFSFDARRENPVEIFIGEKTEARYGTVERLRPIVEEFRRRLESEPTEQRLAAVFENSETEPYPLSAVVVKLAYENDRDCLKKCSKLVRGRQIATVVSDFRLQFYLDEEGIPRAVASRRIFSREPLTDLPPDAVCLRPLVKGFSLTQGFLIDVNWLLKDLPWEIASQVLDDNQALRVPPRGLPIENIGTVFAEIRPLEELGFETSPPEEAAYGKLEVTIDTERIKERIDRQSKRFLGVGLMLVLTLVTGMTLLYRSVRSELEQARRMQNFVAAVTHELRTPVSTIRLHAEMLLDGWACDPEKEREYYERIVRETDRLSILVERVLEKSRLKVDTRTPEPGDLNALLERMARELLPAEGRPLDLRLDLTPGLPPVWMIPDAVASIVSNLVENARKYAHPSPERPIVLRTSPSKDRVLLEVLDRGPGVPPSERERIFEAFYRIGSEATRTTTGTGLGLHLVRIQAEASRARVSVHPRPGGGSSFQVSFEVAPAPPPTAGAD